MLGHSHVSDGVSEGGGKTWLVVPSWGLDYFYRLSGRWAIGVQTDILLDDFKVEDKDKETGYVERSYPFAAIPSAKWKVTRHSSFTLGIGAEFAGDGDFALTRIGYELGAGIPGGWEIAGTLNYDIKWSAYDTWTIGVIVTKSYRHHK